MSSADSARGGTNPTYNPAGVYYEVLIPPGDSAGSMLVHNIAHAGDPDDYMPPPRNKHGIPPLTKEQIGLIRAWIDQGAK